MLGRSCLFSQLRQVFASELSIENYIRALSEFCIIIGLPPNEMLDIAYTEQENHIPAWDSQVKGWFKKYNQHNLDINRSKLTRDSRTTIIKGFFHFYDLDTPKSHTRRKKTDTLRVKNERPALTKELIKKALDAAKTIRIKAIMLTQASSGLAVADVVQLKIQDFYDGLIPITEDGKEICEIHRERAKTGTEFITFLSYEAVDAIKNYIETERRFKDSPWLFQKHKMSDKNPDPQLSEFLVEIEYRTLNKWMKLEHDEPGSFRPITSHMLRKFFNTQLSNSGMGYEPRKHMMGHTITGVDGSYYLKHDAELREMYLRYMDKITINPTKTLTIESPEYRELKDKLKQRADKDDELHKENRELKKMIIEIRHDLENISKDKTTSKKFHDYVTN